MSSLQDPTGSAPVPDVESVLQGIHSRQKAAYELDRYPSAAIRIDRINRVLDLLVRFEARIRDALSADFGYRSAHQTYFAEVVTTAKTLRLAAAGVTRWMRPERRSAGLPFALLGSRAEVFYQPLGVVGIISPWNVPINLTLSPLASVLASGNRAMIKPSEATPETAALMQRMFEYAFDPDEIAVVTGDATVGGAFSRLPFDHLIYTGGEGVARHIMQASAENLTPLTLELGGKSPVVIGRSANLKLAADRIAFGKVFNAGQICLAPDYVLVAEECRDAFIDCLLQSFETMLPRESGGRDFVSIVNSRHAERLRGYVTEAKGRGATVIELEWSARAPVDISSAQNMVPITLVVEPDDDLKVMREEIFGPLLPIKSYVAYDDALAAINSRPRPLAAYYFGTDRREIFALLQQTVSGGVTVNDVIMHYTIDDLPFGGVGPSGMGAYHGFEGFKRFSNARAVYRQSRIDFGRALRPPFGTGFDRISRFLGKYG